MDIRHLTYFVHVAKEKSFTMASQKLHISQPALSKMIKSLEDELGVTLLDRSVKVPTLTDAGENLLEQAQRILVAFDALSKSISDTVNLKKGHLSVGIPPVIGTVFFPKIIADFRKYFPGVKFSMIEDGARKIQEKVSEELIDIGVVITPVNSSHFNICSVIQDQIVLLAHKDHPLASKKKVTMLDLKDEPFIMTAEDFMLHHLILKVCKNAGFEPKIDLITSQWDFIQEMVSLKQGISLLPRPILEKFNIPNIKIIPIESSELKWEIVIITKKGRYISYAMKEFINMVQTTINQKNKTGNT
ncbi:MAG: LysR family transcriptional regulator [Bacillota bacterium]|nr:LysR family transcriptional regulator [Bacillota bacterium]